MRSEGAAIGHWRRHSGHLVSGMSRCYRRLHQFMNLVPLVVPVKLNGQRVGLGHCSYRLQENGSHVCFGPGVFSFRDGTDSVDVCFFSPPRRLF